MIYFWSSLLLAKYPVFNVLLYVSTRAIAALMTSLIVWLVAGERFISFCQINLSAGTREYAPETHKLKGKVPTMGGLLIIGTTLLSIFLWCNLTKGVVWVAVLCLISFGLIGAYDDWCKIHATKGITERTKFLAQLMAASLVLSVWWATTHPSTEVWFPFFKELHPAFGILFIPWALWIIVGTSNAVNLTDGLDGLAAGSLAVNFSLFGLIAYLAGHHAIADYLFIPFVQSAELTIVAAAIVGSLLGFLWFNVYPAQLFMGDVGSLSLGALLALLALMTKQEMLLPIAGILFVAETVSVILQVASMKFRGKRIFRMAPIHHHFELIGWPETKITYRLTLLTVMASALALVIVKLR